MMTSAFCVSQNNLYLSTQTSRFQSCINSRNPQSFRIINMQKRCLRCNTWYEDKDNSPTACSFHGHTNGDRGLLALAPPHQGIDGEWSDGSGVIVYKWNEKTDRPNTGRPNWKKRWSCCAEYGENAPPCRRVCLRCQASLLWGIPYSCKSKALMVCHHLCVVRLRCL